MIHPLRLLPRARARRLLAVALGSALALAVQWASGAAREPSPRIDAPALRFRADFEASANASFAAGDGRATCARPLEPGTGVGGGGRALLARPGEDCAYAARGNLDLRSGTLSFWARAYDWSDGEGRSQTLFETSGSLDGLPFSFFVDSPPEPGSVRFVILHGASGDPRQRLFQVYAPVDWRSGWQKVDLTWDAHEIVIYGNGEVGERLPLVSYVLPELPGPRFRLAPLFASAGAPVDRTLVDEVEIWDQPLPADRIRKRFVAQKGPALEVARLRVPRWSGAPPGLDGRLDEPGWLRATRVPLLPDAETGFLGLSVPYARFAWSDGTLFVAVEAARSDGQAPAGREDVFLPTLQQGDTAPRSWRIGERGIEGAAGAASALGRLSAHERSLTAELAIPLAAPGAAAVKPGDTLRFDLRHQPALPGALAVGARLSAGAGHAGLASLTLGADADGVRLAVSRDRETGALAIEAEREAGGELDASVAHAGKRPATQRQALEGGRGRLALEEPQTAGVLSITARDGGAQELVRLAARVGALDVPGMLLVPEPGTGELAVELDLRWLDGHWQSALASGDTAVTLEDRGPRGVEGPLRLQLEAGRARALLASGLAPGRHGLTLRLEQPGDGAALALRRELDVPPLPWLGAGPDAPARLLEPWLPVVWDGATSARVWGRRYVFDGPLLAQVEGRGGEMLRAPMRLRVRTSAGAATLHTLTSKAGARSDARGELQGSAEFPGAGLGVSWSASIEYDGLVVTSLRLVPEQPGLRIDELALEIPLRGDLVRYLRGTQDGPYIRGGRARFDGRRFESRFEPFVWVANETEGFLYFSESAANWVGAEQSGAVVVRGGADAAIVLRLIGGPVVAPGPLDYQLGFQATPVKPLLPDARAWNFGAAGQPLPLERAVSYYAGFSAGDGIWELARPQAMRREDARLRASGTRVFYYAATSATADIHPSFRLFEPLWRSAWAPSYPGQALPPSPLTDAVPPHRVTGVCPADASLQARMLYDAERLLRTTGGLGVYTDTDDVLIDDNPRHGCGFVDAFGRRGVSWTFLKKRRFAQRLAALVREVGGGRRYWMTHALSRLVPPVHGFADFWYPGEELTGPAARNPFFYVDELDEVAWRVEYASDASGIVHVFLPELSRGSGRREDVASPGPTEALIAMAAVNDVNVSSAWTYPPAVAEYWELRKRLLLVDAEFVGYWRADRPARERSADARVSVYRTRLGPVLVVANRAPRERSIELELDLGALGLSGPIAARDERRHALLAASGAGLSVSLPGRSYTYVSLRAQ